MRKSALPALALATLSLACGDAAWRPIPSGDPQPRPSPQAAPPPASEPPASPTPAPAEPRESRNAPSAPPLEMTAVAVEGFPPLPTYRATVRNVSGSPVRRVIATVVYLDAKGRAMPGEEHDVAFGSPIKAIEPGTTLETSFLSRVDRAPAVRLVAREVTFIEKGAGAEPVPREWKNPKYETELAEARRGR